MIFNDLEKMLWKSLKNVDEWVVTDYYAKHKSGVKLWIANGPFFLDVSDHSGCIGLFSRHIIWFGKILWLKNEKNKIIKQKIMTGLTEKFKGV